MLQRRMITLLTLQCLALGALGLAWAPSADAAEARCNELGANCVCSEPLQMTALTMRSGGAFYNPNDSTTKECNGQGDGLGVGYAVTRGAGDLIVSTSPTMLAALPAGHGVARMLTFPDGYTGGLNIGYIFSNDATFTKRVSTRWYEYYSPNYGFDDDPESCNASKLFEINSSSSGVITDIGYGPPSIYNFLAFNVAGSQDCCGYGQLNVNAPAGVITSMAGPAAGGISPYYQYYRGKWVRWEIVVVNRDSSVNPWEQHIYAKNITDNGPEYEVASSCDTDGGLTLPCGHKKSEVFKSFAVNGFRQNICPGTRAYSHFMVAGWDTNAGQRIGAAVEIEGGQANGGGDTTPPSPPLNLRLSTLELDYGLMARN